MLSIRLPEYFKMSYVSGATGLTAYRLACRMEFSTGRPAADAGRQTAAADKAPWRRSARMSSGLPPIQK